MTYGYNDIMDYEDIMDNDKYSYNDEVIDWFNMNPPNDGIGLPFIYRVNSRSQRLDWGSHVTWRFPRHVGQRTPDFNQTVFDHVDLESPCWTLGIIIPSLIATLPKRARYALITTSSYSALLTRIFKPPF